MVASLPDFACKFAGGTIGGNVTMDINKMTYAIKAALKGSQLKTITIVTTRLKESKIGANAFKNIAKKPVVKCPASVRQNYRKWLIKKGLPKKAAFK